MAAYCEKKWMQFNLVHVRFHVNDFSEFRELADAKVCDTERLYFSFVVKFDHCLPSPIDIAVGLVEHEHVQIIELELFQGTFKSDLCTLVAHIRRPQFRGDKEFLALD